MKLFEAQDQLPDLPVPELQRALAMYISSIEPLTTKEELEYTKSVVADFGKPGGEGVKLHKLLQERAENCVQQRKAAVKGDQVDEFHHPDGTAYPNNHWLEYWWETYAYMADRAPLACYVNCWQSNFASLPCDNSVLRAAWCIVGAMDFKALLDAHEVPPERAGKSIFCSAQYLRIVGTTRIPGIELDRMMSVPESTGIAVERKGHWYHIERADELSPEDLVRLLTEIKKDADSLSTGPEVAAFTGIERDVWAKNRDYLRALSTSNESSLQAIERAVLHIVLSEESPEGLDELQVLGCHAFGRHLWFDKSVSMIVCENGCVISNLEHASADAVVPARWFAYIDEFVHKNCPEVGFDSTVPYKEGVALMPISKFTPKTDVPDRSTESVKRLDFVLDETLKSNLDKAKVRMQELVEDHLVTCLKFEDFGEKSIRTNCKGVSTDSFVQMALALAYYRDQHGEVPATYETATTRSFYHSRTETIRSQSKFSKAFCEAFETRSVTDSDLAALIRKGADYHRNYLRSCMAGQGCDRLLLGLKMLAMENGINHPIFEDPAYTRSTSFTLSTSQMPWAIECYPAFGAYNPNAYGVCYRFTNCDTIVAVVTSRKPGAKDALRFREAIREALRDIYRVLAANPPPPKKTEPISKLFLLSSKTRA